jgi:hypothetical protein
VTEIERNGATAAAAAPGPAGDRGLCDGLLSCQSPHRQIQRQLAAVRINGEKRGRRSGAALVVTGEIMASFAGKPPPFPGAARRSDGKKRTTSEEKENDFFFFFSDSIRFSVGYFLSRWFVTGLRALDFFFLG